MSKYSSDSDYDRRSSTKRSHKLRRRSSSSDSSDSRSRKKRDKKINEKHRSRSYDNRHSKSRRSRSLSRSRKSNRRYDRSRDRKSSNSSDRHRSTERRYKTKSRRSRSRSYIQEYSSKSRRRSSSSSSSSASSTTSTNIKKSSSTQRGKETKIIAQTVTIENKDNDKEPNISSNILDEINDDKFVQKKFSSNAKKVPENIVIDLRKQTIKVPEVEPIEPDTIYHHNLFLNEEARTEKWIKELYTYRQKALQQGIKH